MNTIKFKSKEWARLNGKMSKNKNIIWVVLQQDVIKTINKTFSKEWFSHFNKTYSGDNKKISKEMVEDINKNLKKLKGLFSNKK